MEDFRNFMGGFRENEAKEAKFIQPCPLSWIADLPGKLLRLPWYSHKRGDYVGIWGTVSGFVLNNANYSTNPYAITRARQFLKINNASLVLGNAQNKITFFKKDVGSERIRLKRLAR